MNKTGIVMVLVAIALTMSVASATDWPQFQKDEISVGWTTDCAPIYDPPTLAWSYYTGVGGHAGVDVVPIVGDDQVFVLNAHGKLFAFNPTTGNNNWDYQCSPYGGGFELSTPAYHDGIVYVATSAGDENEGYCRVTALYADGTLREYKDLKTEHGYQLNTPVTCDGDRIYVGDWNGSAEDTNGSGTYWCLDADDVTHEFWNYTPDRLEEGYYWAGAAIVGDYTVFGDDTTNVTCLDSTGAVVDYINIVEQCGIPVAEMIRSSIVWNEEYGRIYFSTRSTNAPPTGHVYAVAFNSATGDLGGDGAMGGGSCEWNYPIGYSTSTPVVHNSRVYVGAGGMWGGGYGVTCLNEADGSWRYDTHDTVPTPGIVQSSPAVSVVNGHIYIYFTTNTGPGKAYCFEDNGSALVKQWEYTASNHILQGMAISSGMVYFGDDDGYVYALAGICGDVNHNGIADMSDALATRNHWFYGFSLCSTWAADTNCNDIVDMSDALAIRNHWFYGFPLDGCCGC